MSIDEGRRAAPSDPAERSGDWLRVTVVGARRRVDLALPAGSAIAEYVPALLRWCGQLEVDEVYPKVWSLGLAAHPVLPPGSSLADAGIVDGAVLHLRDAMTDELDEPVVVDLDELVTDATARPSWDETVRAHVMVLLGVGVVVAALVALVAVAGPAAGPVGAVGLVVGSGLAVSAWLAAYREWSLTVGPRLVLAAGSVAAWGVAGFGLAGETGLGVRLLGAGLGVTLGASLAAVAVRHAAALCGWWIALAGLLVTGLAVLLELDPSRIAAVVVILALVLLGCAPTLAGHLVEADQSTGEESFEEPDHHVASWVARGERYLLGLTVVGAVLVAASTVLLARGSEPFGAATALLVSVAVMVRAGRAGSGGEQVVLLTAGCVGLIGVALASGRAWGLAPWVGPAVVLALAVAAVAVGTSQAALGWAAPTVGSARGSGRWLLVLEALVVLGLLGVFGVFGQLMGLGESL